MSGVVGDPGPELGSIELGGHVSNHLPRPQSCPEEVRGREHGLVQTALKKPRPWV